MKKEDKKKQTKTEEVNKESTKKLNDHYNTVVGSDGIEMLDESPNKTSKLSSQTLIIILLAFSTFFYFY